MRVIEGIWAGVIASPTPTPSVTPTLSFTPTVTGTSGASPTVTPTLTQTSTPTPTPSATPVFQWIDQSFTGIFPPVINPVTMNFPFAAGNSVNYMLAGASVNTNGPWGLFTSTNATNFQYVSTYPNTIIGLYCLTNARYVIFAANESTGFLIIQYSDDNGATWTNATVPSIKVDGDGFSLGQTASDGTNLITAIRGIDAVSYLYSTNMGVTWETNNSSSIEATTGVTYATLGAKHVWIVVNPDGIGFYIDAVVHTPFQSGAASWTQVFNPSTSVKAIHLLASNGTILAGVGGEGAYVNSTDGITWNSGTMGGAPAFSQFSAFIYDTFSTNFIASRNNNNNLMYHSSNASSWFTKFSPDLYIEALTSGRSGPVASGTNNQIERYGF